jgi:pimeloyl-ACP methyl ester carboxylesterase
VAVKAASQNPHLFDKLVLTGPAGIIINRGFKYKCKVRLYRLIKRFFPQFAERRFGSKEYRTLSPIMKESYKKIVNEDLRDCAACVANKVLLVEGDRDTVTTMQEAKIYENAFPNAKLVVISGGHFAFAEQPTQFHLAVEEFLYE